MLRVAILSIVLFLVPAIRLLSQNQGHIKGQVKTESNSAIEFANVFLFHVNDSTKLSHGTMTDSLGRFDIPNIPVDNYRLQVSFMGYSKRVIPLSITGENPKHDLKTITLTEDLTQLKDVEVTAYQNLIQKTEEGIVVKASANLTQIGGSAADLLKNMPGVLTGPDGEILLRGKAPLILINGRTSVTGGSSRSANLEHIASGNVEQIEIITNPSSKYDAEAEGGIINIVLKKNTDIGTNGAFALGAGFGERYRINGAAIVNHKTEKLNLGLAYDNWYTTRTRRVTGDRTQYDMPDDYYLIQRRFDERTIQNQSARFNMDYEPNKHNSFGFETSWLFQGEDNNETLSNTTENQQNEFTSSEKRHSNEVRDFNTLGMLVHYKRKFTNPDKLLTFSINTAFDIDRENTLITTQLLSEQQNPIGDPYQQKTHNYEDSNITGMTVDFTQPVTTQGLIETGYKAEFRILENDFLRQNQVDGNFETDTANTDVFDFKEQIHALYAQYTGWTGEKQTPRWKYSFGLRAEYVDGNGNTTLNPLMVDNTYFHLFPSASAIYYTPGRNMLRLAYSRRINRPSLGQLMPFTDITDSLNQRSGNPELNPELTHSVELNFSPTFKKASASLSLFYRNTSNAILPYTVLYDNGVAFTTPENFGNANTFGIEGTGMFHVLKFWSISLNASAYNQHIENTLPQTEVVNDQFTYFAKLINNFSLWHNARLQIIGNYTSPVAIPQGERLAVYFTDIGFQQTLLKGQGRLGISIQDVFDTQVNGFSISDTNYDFTRTFKLDTRAIMLTFGYTFRSVFKEKLMENKFKNE